MFTQAVDRGLGAVVWLMSGPTNSNDDYERYLAAMADAFRWAADHRPAVAVQVIAAGNPPPDAVWRKRMAEASARAPSNVLFVLVSPSPVIRGVVTAIEWIRPSPYEVATFATFGEAMRRVSKVRPDLVSPLSRLLDEATDKARAG